MQTYKYSQLKIKKIIVTFYCYEFFLLAVPKHDKYCKELLAVILYDLQTYEAYAALQNPSSQPFHYTVI